MIQHSCHKCALFPTYFMQWGWGHQIQKKNNFHASLWTPPARLSSDLSVHGWTKGAVCGSESIRSTRQPGGSFPLHRGGSCSRPSGP